MKIKIYVSEPSYISVQFQLSSKNENWSLHPWSSAIAHQSKFEKLRNLCSPSVKKCVTSQRVEEVGSMRIQLSSAPCDVIRVLTEVVWNIFILQSKFFWKLISYRIDNDSHKMGFFAIYGCNLWNVFLKVFFILASGGSRRGGGNFSS